MMKRFSLLAAGLTIAGLSFGCADVQSRMAFRDGNKKYEQEDYRGAIEDYERAVLHNPEMATARFYLGSAHQALYRPNSKRPDNLQHLEIALEEYKKSLELNDSGSENLKAVRKNTIVALTGLYSDEPYRNFDDAYKHARMLVDENPEETKNLYALANLYEKFGQIEEAEVQYRAVVDLNPNDLQACGALAAFLNKPLWEGSSKFDEAISVLQRCAELVPDDAKGFQKVATFYWDKSFRDPDLSGEEKNGYADKGLEAVEKALELEPDYVDALVYKNLLLRIKASVTTNATLQKQLIDEANLLRDHAVELKKQQDEEAEAAAAAAGEGANEGL